MPASICVVPSKPFPLPRHCPLAAVWQVNDGVFSSALEGADITASRTGDAVTVSGAGNDQAASVVVEDVPAGKVG